MTFKDTGADTPADNQSEGGKMDGINNEDSTAQQRLLKVSL